jgi:uncharacterized protein YndB with AHSA1/START domain
LKTIHHVFDTTAPRDTVFAALTTTQGLSRWWTTIVKAEVGVGAISRLRARARPGVTPIEFQARPHTVPTGQMTESNP